MKTVYKIPLEWIWNEGNNTIIQRNNFDVILKEVFWILGTLDNFLNLLFGEVNLNSTLFQQRILLIRRFNLLTH